MSSLDQDQKKAMEKTVEEYSEGYFSKTSEDKEAQELIQWALGQFSPEDRMVIQLIHLEGLSGKEASQLLGWNVANVKVRAFRVRQKLRRLLTRFLKDEK